MDLSQFAHQVEDFDSLQPREQIRLLAWHLHTFQARALFDNEAIRSCYRQLHLTPPDVSVYLPRMATYRPPDLLKERGGYKLARSIRTNLDRKYGLQHSFVHVSKLLSDLPSKIPNAAEKTFLLEAMKCYRSEAFRACIVMTWNLAFDHLLGWILKDSQRLEAFNAAIHKRYPKRESLIVVNHDHFDDLKESEVIEVCQTAALISKNTTEILREKLKRRNIAAHPSRVVVTQSQADDVVTDLVNNVLLILN
jgi:hypothetical protein